MFLLCSRTAPCKHGEECRKYMMFYGTLFTQYFQSKAFQRHHILSRCLRRHRIVLQCTVAHGALGARLGRQHTTSIWSMVTVDEPRTESF